MNKLVNDEFNIIIEWKSEYIERLISELQTALEDRYSAEEEQESLAYEAEAQAEAEAKGRYEMEQQAQADAEYAQAQYYQQGPEGEC